MSELLKVGAADEISPLFTFKTIGIPHQPRVSSWPLHALLGACALGVAVAQLKESIWDCRKLLRVGERHCVLSVHNSVIFSTDASAISGVLSLRRVLTAVQFGDMRPGMWSCGKLAAKCQMSWGLIWGAFLAMQTNDRELVPPSAGRFEFDCPFSEGKKSCAVLIRCACYLVDLQRA